MPLRARLSLAALVLVACGPKNVPPPQPPAPEPVVEAPEPVDPIPAGFFAVTPQIVVPDVDAAMAFYQTAFEAQPLMAMPGPDGKTMHGEVKIGDSIVMLDVESEEMKSPQTLGGTTAGMMIYTVDVDKAFQTAVDAGATVVMPVADMFWGDRYGVVLDPAGHRWSLAMHVEDLTPEQMQQRAEIAAKARPKKPGKKPNPKKLAKIEQEWKAIAGTPATAKVPQGYHTVTLALCVNDAAAAIDFYKAAFGATELMRMPRPDGKIDHAEVRIGDAVVMLHDEDPTSEAKSPQTLGGTSVMLHHYVIDADAVHGQAVSSGARPIMPLAEMFWGDRYGAVVGPDGYGWGVATHIEDVPPEEMPERMKAQMAAAQGGTPADAAAPAGATPPADAAAPATAPAPATTAAPANAPAPATAPAKAPAPAAAPAKAPPQ